MMTKLENQLRLSLIREHVLKAETLREKASIAISESLRIVLEQRAEEHLEEAEQLQAELRAAG